MRVRIYYTPEIFNNFSSTIMTHNWRHHINCVLNGNLTFLKYQSLVLSAKFGGCVKTFLQYDILLEGGGKKREKVRIKLDIR